MVLESGGHSSESSGIFDLLNSKGEIRKYALKAKFGKKATLIGLRLSTDGLFKEDLFRTRIKTADELFSEGVITKEEARKRKMEAACKYYTYLRKIEFLTSEDYEEAMLKFAQSVGAKYTPTSGGRTK